MDAGVFLKLAQTRSAHILISESLKPLVTAFKSERLVTFKQLLLQAKDLGPFDVILISESEFTSHREILLSFACLIGVQTADSALAQWVDFTFLDFPKPGDLLIEKPPITQRACFLDRDGVLVEDAHYLSDPQRVVLRKRLLPTLKQFQQEGYLLIVITNQSGIGRGFFSEKEFHQVNHQMKKLLVSEGVWLDDIFWSPFYDGCASGAGMWGKSLRKPRCGMIKLASDKYAISNTDSVLIGDRATDLIAGASFGIGKNYLVHSKNCEQEWQELLRYFSLLGSGFSEDQFTIREMQFMKRQEL